MKNTCFIALFTIYLSGGIIAQTVTPNDGPWNKMSVSMINTPEAAFMIRTGDIDNLGFGFPDGFDPFCGRSTDAHNYPWETNPGDAPGTDRILLPSSYSPNNLAPCGADGYSGNYGVSNTKPAPINLPLDILKGAEIKNAYLQLFIDDFQAPELCSRFQMTLNGKRFVEAEKLLNVVNQTGPIGKLITLAIPEEFYPMLQEPVLRVFIDDPVTHAADGYAIDFVKLIVNRNAGAVCSGNIRGVVVDNETGEPIQGASIENTARQVVITDAEGRFEMRDIPAGLEVLRASAGGYANANAVADVARGDEGDEVTILMSKTTKKAMYEGKALQEGESLVINNILFDQGSSGLRPTSVVELEKIVSFMQENPTVEIELSGHTSSEGDAGFNRSLSYKRVKSCKDYIVSKGIAVDRIVAVGYGPDRPAAPNNTEAGRVQNRRVEMRLLKL